MIVMIWRFILQIINFFFFILLGLTLPNILMASTFQEDLKIYLKNNLDKKQKILSGNGEWLQLRSNLDFISHNEFWGNKSINVSKARDLNSRDPLSAIIDFNNKLKVHNIELILVPIPVKTTIYPEQLIPKNLNKQNFDKRIDTNLQNFIYLLKEKDINVIDLYDVFFKSKNTSKMYCKTDSHWTSKASFIAARYVANMIKKNGYHISKKNYNFELIEENISITGDLTKILNENKKETLNIIKVLPADKILSKDSPILVLGDSHTLVFSQGGDFHSKNSGFPDHLAFHIGHPVDLLGVRGSASTVSRIKMVRQNKAKNKKVIIWIFSSREFTESIVGWKLLPVIK